VGDYILTNIPLKVDRLEKSLAILITIMVCVTRLSMAMGEITYVLAICIGILYLYIQKSEIVIPEVSKGYVLAVLIFFISTIPSVIFSSNPFIGIRELFNMWIYRFLVFLLIVVCINKKLYLERMLAAFIAVTGIDCLVALAQVLFIYNPSQRGWGFGSNVLTLAGVLCMLLPVIVVILFDNRFSVLLKKVSQFSIIFIVIGLIVNKSRGAWLTNFALIPCILLQYMKNNKKKIIACILIAIAFLSFIGLNPSYRDRFESITNTTTDRSNADRIWVWKACGDMFLDHPIAGIGLGQFKEHYVSEYKYPQETQSLIHAHNNFVQVAAEDGSLGLIGLVYFLGYFILKSFMNWMKSRNPYDLLIIILVLGYLCLFGQIELTLDNSSGMRIFWFLLAILMKMKILDNESLSYNKKY
jgi:O-antigen ligase